MVSFLQTAKAVHALEPSTHWIHEATLAERLRISTDDLEGWTKCVREGGSGAVSNNTFKATLNPTMSKSIFWNCPLITLSISTIKSTGATIHQSKMKLLSYFVLPNTTSLVRRRVVGLLR
jgi:hypothetical protein